MFSFFKKEKWALVKTYDYGGYNWAAGTAHEVKDLKIYVHYYESDKGNRKIDMGCSSTDVPQNKLEEFVECTHTYQTKTLRWLNGRYDPEIPRYSELGEEDTANALRGKVG